MNIATTPVHSRNLSADLSPGILDEPHARSPKRLHASPIKNNPKGKPPLNPNISSKLETPPKEKLKQRKCRELSKAFVLTKEKFMIKAQNENLKLGFSQQGEAI